MSLRSRALNFWLRRVEKRRFRKGTPAQLRRALQIQARLIFRGPLGTVERWGEYGGVRCLEITPDGARPKRVLLYIHGGAFLFGGPDTHSAMAATLAHRIGARAVLPRYRLAPEAPFPAAPDDVRAVWDALLSSGVAPGDIVLGGDSAGGALAFGLIASLCAQGAVMPGAVFGLSPLTDLTYSGDSFRTNAQRDVLLPAERAAEISELFLQGAEPDTPSVSPLSGDFHGAPPAWITVGDTEILLDDARRLWARMVDHGAQATLVIARDLPHVWPMFHNLLPETRATLDDLAQWIRQQQGWHDRGPVRARGSRES